MATKIVLLVLGCGAMAAIAAAVWLGWWRRWADPADALGKRVLFVPWGVAAIFLGLAAKGVDYLGGPEIPDKAVLVLMGIAGIVGVMVAAFDRPRWALPPWYRRALDKVQFLEERDEARRQRRHRRRHHTAGVPQSAQER